MIPHKSNPGDVHGRLTVIEYDHIDKHHQRHYRYRCECGNELVANGNNVRRGKTVSCGCKHKPHGHTANGKTSPTYYTWAAIIERCTKPKHHRYHDYGGRGITVCDRWLKFENFLTDISNTIGLRPEGCTIDRIDNNRGYEPGNIKWSTPKEQAANRRPPAY